MGKKITIYSTPTCPYCNMAKEYLDEKGIEYVDKDVSTDSEAAEEMIAKSGQMGVPVIEVGGKTIVGFDKQELEAALAGDEQEGESEEKPEEQPEEK